MLGKYFERCETKKMKSLKAMLWSTEGGNLLWSTEVYWSLLWSTEGFRMSTVVLYVVGRESKNVNLEWKKLIISGECCCIYIQNIYCKSTFSLKQHLCEMLRLAGQMERVGEWWQAWNCDLNLFPENGFDFSELVTKSKIDFLFLRWFKIMMLASYHMVAHCCTILLSLLGIKI